jgi:indole-3-glycerol phosphate synthase
MNILDKIVQHKLAEVALRKAQKPVAVLERQPAFVRPILSLQQAIRDRSKTGIIAEFKRQSPSKGVINADASVIDTTRAYVQAGAAALSVLTDTAFFGGLSEDLQAARISACPILRKDFVIDEYQILEARALGADAILLIAAILTPEQATSFARLAHALGLEVLLEVHSQTEWRQHQHVGADLVGVNNRNLKTFEVSINLSKEFAHLLPGAITKVSESGIDQPAVIEELRAHGYDGFLMGEYFMKHADPGQAAKEFMLALPSR